MIPHKHKILLLTVSMLFVAFIAENCYSNSQQIVMKANGIAQQGKGVILWAHNGYVKLFSDNNWLSKRKINLLPITSAINDEMSIGVLITGARPNKDDIEDAVVINMDNAGKILRSWVLKNNLFWSVYSGSEGRYATTGDGYLVSLNNDETVEKIQKVGGRVNIVYMDKSSRILCQDRKNTKESPREPHCTREGDVSWEATGQWHITPVKCGDFIVEDWSSHGKKGVLVRSIQNGVIVKEHELSEISSIVCHDNKQIFVKSAGLKVFSIPDLLPNKTAKVCKAKNVDSYTISDNRLYCLSGSGKLEMVDL